jgi:hypothetical protein
MDEHHAIKTCPGVERYTAPSFLTSALGGGEWSSSRLDRFPTRKSPHIYWMGGGVGPRAVLDVTEKRKIPAPAGNRIPAIRP